MKKIICVCLHPRFYHMRSYRNTKCLYAGCGCFQFNRKTNKRKVDDGSRQLSFGIDIEDNK